VGEQRDLTVRALDVSTFAAWEELAARHSGAGMGCWCTWFHPTRKEEGIEPKLAGPERKRQLVEQGRAHAALVFEGESAVGWCQFGTPEELPRIYHRKEYLATAEVIPDYRITCIFIARRRRRQGIASVAVAGALELIAAAGGGLVEAYPQDVPEGAKVSASFLYNGIRSTFERAGFTYLRPKGKNHYVMSKMIDRCAPEDGVQRPPGNATTA